MSVNDIPPEIWYQILREFDLENLWSFYKAFGKSRHDQYVASLTAECASKFTEDQASKLLIRILFSSDVKVSLIISGDLAQLKSTPSLQPPRRRRRRKIEDDEPDIVPLPLPSLDKPLTDQATTIKQLYKERRENERREMVLRSTTVDCEITDVNLHLRSLKFYHDERGNLAYIQLCSTSDTKPNISVHNPVEVFLMQIVLQGGYQSGYLNPTFMYVAMESHYTTEVREGYHVTTVRTFLRPEAGWLVEGNRWPCSRIRLTSNRRMPSEWHQRLGHKVNVTARLYRKISRDSVNELRQLSVEFCRIEIPLEIHYLWQTAVGKLLFR